MKRIGSESWDESVHDIDDMCEECDGTGIVPVDERLVQDCTVCDGSGFKPDDAEAPQ